MREPASDALWEFRYLSVSPQHDLGRQNVIDDFGGWEFVSLCYQSHVGEWYCVFKRRLPTTLTGALAA